jgi:hypothetical protein
MAPENGWDQYQKLVLFRLDTQRDKLTSIDDRLKSLQSSVFILKFKVGLIGTAAGTVSAALLTGILRWISF